MSGRQDREKKIVSDRIFGSVWCAIIGVFSLLPLWHGEAINTSLATVAVLLALIAAATPGWLAVPNRLWTRFGKFMHGVTSYAALFMIYFLFFTPGAALLRLCGRYQLSRHFDPRARTYWVECPPGDTDFTRPY